MNRLTLAFIAAVFALSAGPAVASNSMSGGMHSSMMPSCKSPVVYAVPKRNIYYMRGQHMYGHAKGGTYMCQAAANAKGMHMASKSMKTMH